MINVTSVESQDTMHVTVIPEELVVSLLLEVVAEVVEQVAVEGHAQSDVISVTELDTLLAIAEKSRSDVITATS